MNILNIHDHEVMNTITKIWLWRSSKHRCRLPGAMVRCQGPVL